MCAMFTASHKSDQIHRKEVFHTTITAIYPFLSTCVLLENSLSSVIAANNNIPFVQRRHKIHAFTFAFLVLKSYICLIWSHISA